MLLRAGSHPTQLLFHAALDRMAVQYPHVTNDDLDREQGMPESTSMMQDGSHLDEAPEVAKSRVPV